MIDQQRQQMVTLKGTRTGIVIGSGTPNGAGGAFAFLANKFMLLAVFVVAFGAIGSYELFKSHADQLYSNGTVYVGNYAIAPDGKTSTFSANANCGTLLTGATGPSQWSLSGNAFACYTPQHGADGAVTTADIYTYTSSGVGKKLATIPQGSLVGANAIGRLAWSRGGDGDILMVSHVPGTLNDHFMSVNTATGQATNYTMADGTDIFTGDADGSLDNGAACGGVNNFAWSPDGNSINYVVGCQDPNNLVLQFCSYAIAGQTKTCDTANRVTLPRASYGTMSLASVDVSYSVDGSQVAYTYNGKVYVADANGGSAAAVADYSVAPAAGSGATNPNQPDVTWLPDDSGVLYMLAGNTANAQDIYRANTDGSAATLFFSNVKGLPLAVTVRPVSTQTSPVAAPPVTNRNYTAFNSGQIAYSSNKVTTVPKATTGPILVSALDGTAVKQLTTPPANYQDYNVAWSPNGQQVAFLRTPIIGTATPALYVMNVDGTGLTQLATTGYTLGYGTYGAVVWSPDGATVVTNAISAAKQSVLLLVPVNGSAPSEVPNTGADTAYSSNPQVPFGWDYQNYVYYTQNNTVSRFPICRIGVDGSNQSCFANGEVPALSPDGKTLAYVGDNTAVVNGGTQDGLVHIMGVDGSNPVTLPAAQKFQNISSLSWLRDGSAVLVNGIKSGTTSGLYSLTKDAATLATKIASLSPTVAGVSVASAPYTYTASCTITGVAATVATGTAITPVVTVKNTGTGALTPSVQYHLDYASTGATQTAAEMASLAAGQSRAVTMPKQTVTSGFGATYTLNVSGTDSNYEPLTGKQVTSSFTCNQPVKVTVPTIASVSLSSADWKQLTAAKVTTDSSKSVVQLASNALIDTAKSKRVTAADGSVAKVLAFFGADAGHTVTMCVSGRSTSSKSVTAKLLYYDLESGKANPQASKTFTASYSSQCFDFTAPAITTANASFVMNNSGLQVSTATNAASLNVQSVTVTLKK